MAGKNDKRPESGGGARVAQREDRDDLPSRPPVVRRPPAPPAPRNAKNKKPPRPAPPPALPWLGAVVLWIAAAALFYRLGGLELLLLGTGLGALLQHYQFGFAAPWRETLRTGKAQPLRGLFLLLALMTALFATVLPDGTVFGRSVTGAIYPVGPVLLLGAFLFGLGMQLAGGCASGCLYALGGGGTRMLAAIPLFCLGGLLATLHQHLWDQLPQVPFNIQLPVTLPGPLLQSGFFLLLWGLVAWRGERGKALFGPAERAAALIALLAFAVLLVSGKPWSITWGLTLLAAKAAFWVGLPLTSVPFWHDGANAAALLAPLSAEPVVVTDLGLVLGAFLAASLAGRWRPGFHQPGRSWLAAALGGLLMGYGARLSYGCNIGALVDGIASMSLHGWLWLAGAAAGSLIGGWLRPWFKLSA